MLANGAEDSIGASPPDRPAKKSTRETLREIRVKLDEAFRRGHYDSDDEFDFFHGAAWTNNIVTTIEGLAGARSQDGG